MEGGNDALSTLGKVGTVHHIFPFLDLLELIFADSFDGPPNIASKTKHQWGRFARSNTFAFDNVKYNFDAFLRVSRLLPAVGYEKTGESNCSLRVYSN